MLIECCTVCSNGTQDVHHFDLDEAAKEAIPHAHTTNRCQLILHVGCGTFSTDDNFKQSTFSLCLQFRLQKNMLVDPLILFNDNWDSWSQQNEHTYNQYIRINLKPYLLVAIVFDVYVTTRRTSIV
jgi:hypothetical protein